MSGTQLPTFAAAASGLFAEYGLEVELVDPLSTSGYSLPDFAERIRSVARGDVDFAMSAVAYVLAAQTEAKGSLPARFVAVLHQKDPIAALVPESSGLRNREDLPGRLTARGRMSWFFADYAAALARLGLGPPVAVEMPDGTNPASALAHAQIDVLPGFVEMAPGRAKAGGAPMRAIPLDIEVYASGLVAADRLPLELVSRMRRALTAGFHLQRAQPEVGIAEFARRFPNAAEEEIRANWSLFRPYAFAGAAPGAMEPGRRRVRARLLRSEFTHFDES